MTHPKAYLICPVTGRRCESTGCTVYIDGHCGLLETVAIGKLLVPVTATRMILCEICGNKRCPHATDSALACTNSNEPGQPGSAYPAWPEGKWLRLRVTTDATPAAPTPETDAVMAKGYADSERNGLVWSVQALNDLELLARRLERERDEALRDAERQGRGKS